MQKPTLTQTQINTHKQPLLDLTTKMVSNETLVAFMENHEIADIEMAIPQYLDNGFKIIAARYAFENKDSDEEIALSICYKFSYEDLDPIVEMLKSKGQ